MTLKFLESARASFLKGELPDPLKEIGPLTGGSLYSWKQTAEERIPISPYIRYRRSRMVFLSSCTPGFMKNELSLEIVQCVLRSNLLLNAYFIVCTLIP